MTNDATISRFDKGSEHYQTDSIKYRKLSADRVSQLRRLLQRYHTGHRLWNRDPVNRISRDDQNGV